MTEPTPLAFRQDGEGWHLDPPRDRVTRLGLGAVAALAVVVGVGNVSEGETVPGLSVLGLALVTGVPAVVMSRRPRRVTPRHLPTDPGPGLLLPVRGGGLGAVVGFGVLALVLLVGVTGTGVVMAAGGRWQGLVGVAIGIGLGALFLVGALGALRARRTADRGILLTPDAVVLRTRTEPETIPWPDLVRVRDHWGRAVRVGPTMPDDVVRNWLTFETREPGGDRMSLLSGSPSPTVPVETLGTDPRLALEVCRHYLDHPVDRPGLADPDAVARWS